MKSFFISLLLIYLLLMILLYVLQRKLLYYPTTEPVQSHHQSIVLNSAELKLNVVIDNPNARHAVIYLGGNAENVWWTAEQFRQLFEGYAVYYLNYPGYGGSSGSPTEETIMQAANSLYQLVDKHHDSITVMGRSLGTGVAVALAARYDVSGLILVSPYDSISNVAASHYPIFPTRWLVKDRFDSVSRADTVRTDVLVLIASDDRVVPPRHSQKLVEKLKWSSLNSGADLQGGQRVDSFIFEGLNHNNIDSHPDFVSRIRSFIARETNHRSAIE